MSHRPALPPAHGLTQRGEEGAYLPRGAQNDESARALRGEEPEHVGPTAASERRDVPRVTRRDGRDADPGRAATLELPFREAPQTRGRRSVEVDDGVGRTQADRRRRDVVPFDHPPIAVDQVALAPFELGRWDRRPVRREGKRIQVVNGKLETHTDPLGKPRLPASTRAENRDPPHPPSVSLELPPVRHDAQANDTCMPQRASQGCSCPR